MLACHKHVEQFGNIRHVKSSFRSFPSRLDAFLPVAIGTSCHFPTLFNTFYRVSMRFRTYRGVSSLSNSLLSFPRVLSLPLSTLSLLLSLSVAHCRSSFVSLRFFLSFSLFLSFPCSLWLAGSLSLFLSCVLFISLFLSLSLSLSFLRSLVPLVFCRIIPFVAPHDSPARLEHEASFHSMLVTV